MGKIRSLFLAALFGSASLVAAHAADLDGPVFQGDQFDAREPMVEFGTGWYLRGDIAGTSEKTPKLDAALTFPTLPQSRKSWAADIGFGYKYNNWFRTDLVYEYRNVQEANGKAAAVVCPYSATTLADPVTLAAVGVFYNPAETCDPSQSASLATNSVMAGGYVDLGTFSRVTPYVGAGVGVTTILTKGSVKYTKTSDGSAYAADLTAAAGTPAVWVDAAGNPVAPQPNIAFAPQNWDRSVRNRNWNLSWALMAGIAIDISKNAKLDLGYRYVNLGKYSSVSAGGVATENKLTAHELRAGIRYMID